MRLPCKNAEEIITKLFLGKDVKEHIFIVDYKNVNDPIVTMSTGLIFQNFSNKGVSKIIIKNHKFKDKLLENPAIKMLMSHNKLEII
jgi:hypothetical protein